MLTEKQEVVIADISYANSAFGVTKEGHHVFFNKKLVVVGTNPIPIGFPRGEEIKPVALPFHFQGVRALNPPELSEK